MAITRSAKRQKAHQATPSFPVMPSERATPGLTSLPPEVLCSVIEHNFKRFKIKARWDANERSWHVQPRLPGLDLMLGNRMLRDAAEAIRAYHYNGIMELSFAPGFEPQISEMKKQSFWKRDSSPKSLPRWPSHLDWIRRRTHTIEWYFPKKRLELRAQRKITPIPAELGGGVKVTIDFQHFHGTYMWIRSDNSHQNPVEKVVTGKKDREIAGMARKQLRKPLNKMIAEFLLPEEYIASSDEKGNGEAIVPIVNDVEYAWRQQSSFKFVGGWPDRYWGENGLFVAETSFDSQLNNPKAIIRRRWDREADAKWKIDYLDESW